MDLTNTTADRVNGYGTAHLTSSDLAAAQGLSVVGAEASRPWEAAALIARVSAECRLPLILPLARVEALHEEELGETLARELVDLLAVCLHLVGDE